MNASEPPLPHSRRTGAPGHRALALLALVVTLGGGAVAGAQDPATNARAKQILRNRKHASAESVATSIARDRDPSLPALALGIYLAAAKQVDGQEAARLAMLAAARRDLADHAMTIIAVSRHFAPIVDALMADASNPRLSREAAARILAIYSHLAVQERNAGDGTPTTAVRVPRGAKKNGLKRGKPLL